MKNGDDIVSIAIAVGISPSQLMDINDMKPEDELKPGMVLKLIMPIATMAALLSPPLTRLRANWNGKWVIRHRPWLCNKPTFCGLVRSMLYRFAEPSICRSGTP